ncbi:MAG: hypothetical protein ACLS6T_01760 [Alistipes sp.]|uniref:hypothetical protein n=1 Tax=Alistipes sp. TaxID=1872444 RepID=UPI003991FCE0
MKSAIIVICFVFVNVRLSRARHAARRFSAGSPCSRKASCATLPPAINRMQAAPEPARTPGLKAMQKYKKLSGLHNNFPPTVIIFTKRE